MDLHNLSPWNWFKKEHGGGASAVPVHYQKTESNFPVQRLHQEIDQVFNNFLRGNGSQLIEGLWPSLETGTMFNPQLDIQELADSYSIAVEVPGIDRQDVDVQIQGDTMLISGEKKQEDEKNEGNYHCIERRYGAFRRILTLPEDADVDKITANYKEGMLNVEIKKNPDAKPLRRRIEIDQMLN